MLPSVLLLGGAKFPELFHKYAPGTRSRTNQSRNCGITLCSTVCCYLLSNNSRGLINANAKEMGASVNWRGQMNSGGKIESCRVDFITRPAPLALSDLVYSYSDIAALQSRSRFGGIGF